MGSEKRQKLSGYGWDWTSKRARRVHLWKAGVGKFIKRTLNKKLRQANKHTADLGL